LVGTTREQWSESGSGTTFIGYLAYPASDLTQRSRLTVREKVEDSPETPEDMTWKFLDPWRVEVTRS
jgi:hypothetical protein